MSVGEKQHYAELLSQANMLPKQYQANPANVFLAIELGNALGIPPIVAINEINVINGTPAPSASLMASLARSGGHRVRAWNDEDGSAVCEIIRHDDQDFTHRSVWDEKKARDSGLWGKGHWSKDPATMLRWRAISECVRLACPEVLGGLKYTPEEVMEFKGPDTSSPVQSRPRRQQPTPKASPAPTGEDRDWYAELDECESLDDLKRIGADINAAGRADEFRDTLNAMWVAIKNAEPPLEADVVQAEVVDDATGEIINNQQEN